MEKLVQIMNRFQAKKGKLRKTQFIIFVVVNTRHLYKYRNIYLVDQ
jgi:hypothetical protein